MPGYWRGRFCARQKARGGTLQRGGARPAHRLRPGVCGQGGGSGGARGRRGGFCGPTHRGGGPAARRAPPARRCPPLCHPHAGCYLPCDGSDEGRRALRCHHCARQVGARARATCARAALVVASPSLPFPCALFARELICVDPRWFASGCPLSLASLPLLLLPLLLLAASPRTRRVPCYGSSSARSPTATRWASFTATSSPRMCSSRTTRSSGWRAARAWALSS